MLSTYINCSNHINEGKMKQHISMVEHLNEILKTIDDDLVLALNSHEKEKRGGFMSIPRSVFCCVDYLGALTLNGKTGTANAVKYMEKYFIAANSKYDGKCLVLFDMWRNGTVHQYTATTYNSEKKGFNLLWGANNSSEEHNRKSHLKCFCMKDNPDSYYWFINLFDLIEDLKSSINHLLRDIQLNPSDLSTMEENFKTLSHYGDLDAKSWLLPDVEKLIEQADGIIDQNFQVQGIFKNQTERMKFKEEWKK